MRWTKHQSTRLDVLFVCLFPSSPAWFPHPSWHREKKSKPRVSFFVLHCYYSVSLFLLFHCLFSLLVFYVCHSVVLLSSLCPTMEVDIHAHWMQLSVRGIIKGEGDILFNTIIAPRSLRFVFHSPPPSLMDAMDTMDWMERVWMSLGRSFVGLVEKQDEARMLHWALVFVVNYEKEKKVTTRFLGRQASIETSQSGVRAYENNKKKTIHRTNNLDMYWTSVWLYKKHMHALSKELRCLPILNFHRFSCQTMTWHGEGGFCCFVSSTIPYLGACHGLKTTKYKKKEE